MEDSLFLDADEFRDSTFVRHVEIHDSLGSTNDRAAELARDTTVELPALVTARHQAAGRGRGTHKWWSTDGALTFSLLLDPSTFGIAQRNWPQLSLTTAVAICDAIQSQLVPYSLQSGANNPQSEIHDPKSPRVGIKWPNDVLLDGRKIAGILIESPGGAAPAKDRLTIGIGVNVNNSWHDAPAEVLTNGIALCDVTGRTHDLQWLLLKIVDSIENRIDELNNHPSALSKDWQQLNLLAGQRVTVEATDRRIDGVCQELSDDGALILSEPGGVHRIYSGSVRL